MTAILAAFAGLLVLALLIVGAYFAGQYLNPEASFRYRFSPFHGLAILGTIGFVIWMMTVPEAQYNGIPALTLSAPWAMLMLVLLGFDLALQYMIRSRKFYLVECIVIAVLLTKGVPEFI